MGEAKRKVSNKSALPATFVTDKSLATGISDAKCGVSPGAGDDAASIKVEVTDAKALHCFRITIGKPYKGAPLKMLFHARSLMDLHHKLSLTFLDRNSDFYGVKLPFNAMPEEKRFGLDQDLDTIVTHENGLLLFDISGHQFTLEMVSALQLWISIGQAFWQWSGSCVDIENAILMARE
jgi:hypothetical protein